MKPRRSEGRRFERRRERARVRDHLRRMVVDREFAYDDRPAEATDPEEHFRVRLPRNAGPRSNRSR